MRKTKKTQFQQECEAYMKGEMEYLGIYKDKDTGYVHSIPTAKRTGLRGLINRIFNTTI